ncbi:MAG: efflux transporter outer membrane subunit [Mariprofundaceae bacterium]
MTILLAGCAVGPDFKTPASPTVERYSNELKQPVSELELTLSDDVATSLPQLLSSDTIPAQWWQLFESDPLELLIQRSLKASPTLQVAEARLQANQETLAANTGSILYPNIDGSFGSTRQKISGASFGGRSLIFSLQNASLDMSYSLDPAGGGRRLLEFGRAQVEYEVIELHAARITLVSNIVTSVIREASLRDQISALIEIIDAQKQQLELSEKKFDIGVISKVEVLSQRASLAQTRTQLPSLQQSLSQTRHQLATLSGELPSEARLPEFHLDDLTLPHQIPVTLPSQLTRQRPDIRASEALLHQASAQVGVATANLYPSLTLTGRYGSEASNFSDLFSAGTSVWGIGAGLLQPIFHGGALQAKKRAAVASYQQAAAQYREDVLTAFQDVADALLALEMDGKKLILQEQAEAFSSETYDLVNAQYRQGAASYLDLLNAQSQYQQSRIALLQARAALYTDTAVLMFALGGGWWNDESTSLQESKPIKKIQLKSAILPTPALLEAENSS